MAFLQENLSTILVGLLVLTIFLCIVLKLLRDRKAGKGGCSCGCGSCSGNCPFGGAAGQRGKTAEQEKKAEEKNL
ncbi:MAG: FeoB-associated Cys-rich membrane protein [Bacillota bacterium]|nr:FeoB-associated Cys-rich membrane protein [Bacillota bacterium]